MTRNDRRTRFFIFVLTTLLTLPFASVMIGAEKDGPTTDGAIDLFHGATLDDFDCYLIDNGKKEEAFSLSEDGTLKVSGHPFGWLGTKKEYRNFVLSVDYRFLTPEGETNSGILVRIGETIPTSFLPHCVEIGLEKGDTGTFFGFYDFHVKGEDSRMVYYKDHEYAGNCDQVNKIRDAAYPDLTAWNRMEIFCCGDILIIKINGIPMNWGVMAEDYAGKVAFQSEGGVVEFRNALLTEMP